MQEDTLRGLEMNQRSYLQESSNQIDMIGSENFMEQMNYEMPETWLRFPMQKGDSVSGYFDGAGPYCERFFLRRFGTYMTKADATGKIVLPQGDTLRNVIRLHTERYVGTIALPIDTMRYKIPVFTVDSIVRQRLRPIVVPLTLMMLSTYRTNTLTTKMGI